MDAITNRTAPASGLAPLASATAVGGGIGMLLGRANDLGGSRGTMAGLGAGVAVGALGYAGTKLLPRIGVDPDLANRTMAGAAIAGAIMGTAQLHGMLQMSNPNGMVAALGFTAAAALVGATIGAGYHAVRN
jgi:hypothetical protein